MSISSVMNIAVQGMTAQTHRVGVIASNIANMNTPGYSRLDAALSSAGPGTSGVQAFVTSSSQAVDPAMEMIDLIDAEIGFKANAAVFETGADLWDLLMTVKRD